MIYHALIRETFHIKQTNITYFLFPQTLLVNPNFVAATCESSSRCAQGRGKAVFFLVSKARLWCQLAGNPRFSKNLCHLLADLSPCCHHAAANRSSPHRVLLGPPLEYLVLRISDHCVAFPILPGQTFMACAPAPCGVTPNLSKFSQRRDSLKTTVLVSETRCTPELKVGVLLLCHSSSCPYSAITRETWFQVHCKGCCIHKHDHHLFFPKGKKWQHLSLQVVTMLEKALT